MGSLSRYGVLVGNSEFKEFSAEELAPLQTPLNDVRLLKAALSERARGAFETECLENRCSNDVREALESLIIKAKDSSSLGLIYYSGHGLLDQTGRLHLATADSRPGAWTKTISLSDLGSLIRIHKPQRLVIILDCCYSGAGIKDMELKSAGNGALAQINDSFRQLEGRGVVMLTATTPIQQASASTVTGFGVFTRHLAEGIGKAKARGTRRVVTVSSLYSYVAERMREEGCTQTPMLWNAQSGGEIELSGSDLIGTQSRPIDPRLGWKLVRQERAPILNVIGPTYILDKNYNFIDWNTAFELIVAHPLGLIRGSHVESFLKHLRNWGPVFQRSNEKFVPGNIPTIDVETLEYDSHEYGLIVFNKIATQLNTSNRLRVWCVNLNVSSVQRADDFWRAMEDALRRDLNWSRYALSYDKIISHFTDYERLLNMVVDNVGNAIHCADLGAGTGNATIKLLETNKDRYVLAVEKNEAMLDSLQRKLEQGCGLARRALLYKGDITTCLMEERESSLDACIMLNVLFALDHPKQALAAVARVLRKGGILSMSTSHTDTDVRKLFGQMQLDLRQRRQWDERTASTWEDAFSRNLDMEEMIRKHSKAEIRQLVEEAGLRIEEFVPSEYVDCVVVIKATKP
jgi:ubiquinone/menaquinone biosynthesis C-methylase UbiE